MYDKQKCNSRGCLQCPLVNDKNRISVNGNSINVPQHLNCKSKHIIYMWVCKLCNEKEVYFGRTTQKCHDRTSGHRGCFNEKKWENSALSMHAREVHQTEFSLKIFSISVVKKVSPQHLRREEFKFIDKYRTNSLGLNRYKVWKIMGHALSIVFYHSNSSYTFLFFSANILLMMT